MHAEPSRRFRLRPTRSLRLTRNRFSSPQSSKFPLLVIDFALSSEFILPCPYVLYAVYYLLASDALVFDEDRGGFSNVGWARNLGVPFRLRRTPRSPGLT
jgi:hypothetical protein